MIWRCIVMFLGASFMNYGLAQQSKLLLLAGLTLYIVGITGTFFNRERI